MADKKPVKATYSGTDTNGLAEFTGTDTIGVVDGGTGLATVATDNILTGNGTSALSAESNLTFDGTNLTMGTGNLIVGTSGKGIDFSATSDGAGTDSSELLDDYEEGTWTPVWKFGTTVQTQTDNAAWYTRVGRIVIVHYRGALANSPTGGTGLTISGLPYTTQNSTNYYLGTGIYSNLIAFGDGIIADVSPNVTDVIVNRLISANSNTSENNVQPVNPAQCTQYSQIRFTLAYTV